MSTLIKNLKIKNFKSVHDLSLECNGINIFIGKPNAGKSNILEAISLLGAGYSEGRFMEGFMRYKTLVQLFSDFDFHSPIEITADKIKAILREEDNVFDFTILFGEKDSKDQDMIWGPIPDAAHFIYPLKMSILRDGSVKSKSSMREGTSPVKKYDFRLIENYQEKALFLQPPHGDNLYLIVRSHPQLREEISAFLKPNGLKLLLDEENQRMAVVQENNSSLLIFPMTLLPDTLQRYIFHLAAIMSNRNSVLLFEEPESHSYAPYVYQLAQHILQDEGNNQFFITTHNPYFLLPILQEGKDVAVFATWFENYETHARKLSEEEIREVLDYGIDIFLNLDQFTSNESVES